MTITFEAKPIETAPKDRDIAIWCPKRGRWVGGRWEDQKYHSKPKPYWATYRPLAVLDDRNDQPTHWAELSEMAIPDSPPVETLYQGGASK